MNTFFSVTDQDGSYMAFNWRADTPTTSSAILFDDDSVKLSPYDRKDRITEDFATATKKITILKDKLK